MQEPERKEGEVDKSARQPQSLIDGAPMVEPKAYAFDGWSMVPLEPVSA